MKYIFLVLISIISGFILWINIKLYSENFTFEEKKTDVILQLNFLDDEIKNNNLAEKMQQIFPEGYVFTHVLYGLSWCELVLSDSDKDINLKKRGLDEAIYSYQKLNSEFAKQTFDNSLKPEYGIFYSGWKNYLLSKILSIDTTFNGHDSLISTFSYQCDSIIKAMKESKTPFLESYYHHSWPADMFVAMASLKNSEKIFGDKYEKDIQSWLKKAREKLDTKTQMIPHEANFETGQSFQGARGCSMSLMLRMLAEIDPQFAQEQFNLFSEQFVTTTFGLPTIREYPKGQDGEGDVDSGPVIFGVGFSATIVMMGTYAKLGCEDLFDNQYKTINAFGFERSSKKYKSYLFGKLPMADAFIAWGRAGSLKNNDKCTLVSDKYWRVQFQLISIATVLVLWTLYFWRKLAQKIRIFFRR